MPVNQGFFEIINHFPIKISTQIRLKWAKSLLKDFCLKRLKHAKEETAVAASSFSSLLEMVLLGLGRLLPQITVFIRLEATRLRVHDMGDVCRMAAFAASLVAPSLDTSANFTITEIENCIFIHCSSLFLECRNFCIGLV